MAIDASLWGLFNFTSEIGSGLTKPGQIGCQYGYVNLRWMPGSPIFGKARATGLRVARLAERHHWSTCWASASTTRPARQYTANNYKGVEPYVHGSYLNAKNVRFEPNNWLNAAHGRHRRRPQRRRPDLGDLRCRRGRAREVGPEAAERRHRRRLLLQRRHARRARREDPDEIPARADAAGRTSRRRWRATTASSTPAATADFGKPRPLYTIAKPPFYAAWATPVIHDTRAGLRINGSCQVVDMNGEVIPGLYCGGESAGGFSMHGLARCTTPGLHRRPQCACRGGEGVRTHGLSPSPRTRHARGEKVAFGGRGRRRMVGVG